MGPDIVVTPPVCTPKVAVMPDCVCGVTVESEVAMISDAVVIVDVSTVEPTVGKTILVIGAMTRLEIVGMIKVSAAETTPIDDTQITHSMRKADLLIFVIP